MFAKVFNLSFRSFPEMFFWCNGKKTEHHKMLYSSRKCQFRPFKWDIFFGMCPLPSTPFTLTIRFSGVFSDSEGCKSFVILLSVAYFCY